MYIVSCKIVKECDEGTVLLVSMPNQSLTRYERSASVNGYFNGQLQIDDGRFITARQRRLIYATMNDIALYTGYPSEEVKSLLKDDFIAQTGIHDFSFADCSISIAKRFISHLIEFVFKWQIPLNSPVLERCDDIERTLFAALKHSTCIICGQPGEVHHWDAIGMGRDRSTYDDGDHRKICLCRQHHNEAHNIGRDTFSKKYHVYGVVFNTKTVHS